MSSNQRSIRTASHHRRRYPSKSSSPTKSIALSQDSQRFQSLLQQFPEPCPSLNVIQCVGEGTFSKVFLVKQGEKKVAVKHLVPTASPDRILMEVECLKMAEGKHNVLQLLYVHRHLGDVILAMPYIDCCKFSDIVRTMDHVEVRNYMRNLFQALAHIHHLGIIHRDIKPANFLYDRGKKVFKLVDFGLAQKVGESSHTREPKSKHPSCKRKLTSSDLANSMESPPPCPSDKRRRLNHPSGERGVSRKVLTDKTTEDLNVQQMTSPKGTPSKTTEKPDDEYYDKRGAILSARKRTRSSTRQNRPKLSDDLDPGESDHETVVICSKEEESIPKTPNKNLESIKGTPEVRRSPRKHPSSVMSKPSTPGFSKLTISGSAIINDQSSTLKRQTSFTILDPASGVPSDGTPRLQASLTSRHSALMLPAGNANFLQLANFHSQASLMMNNSVKEALTNRFATPNAIRRTACNCFGRPQVCSKCLSRKPQRAARAGTPGFRPPEVLLKFEHQTTAVDMWAAGVILLCILSRTYPFFRAPDDYTALAELVALFGTKAVQEAACQYGKRFICSENSNGVDLQTLCQRLAERRQGEDKSQEVGSSLNLATDQAVDLLKKVLALSAHERWTAEDALQHPFFED